MRPLGACRKSWAKLLDDEIRSYIELETRDNLERGMDPEEARRAAIRKFGNITRVQEDTRAIWRALWLDHFAQDVRYAFRTLRRQPGFTTIVVLTLALSIGMNTAVFSILHTVLVRPLPYPNADHLVWLANYHQQTQNDNLVARADYLAWKQQAYSFEEMAAYGNQDLSFVADHEATQERVVSVTGDFWNIAGIQPALGRLPNPGETNCIVLSSALFDRRFHGGQEAIGRTVWVNGWPFTVIGVLPKTFRLLFPQQFATGDEVREFDAYIPIPDALMRMPRVAARQWDEATSQYGPAPFWLVVIGRVRADVPMAVARAEMQAIYTRNAQQNPNVLRQSRILKFAPLQEKVAGRSRRPLVVLLVAVGLVLLIACANITNLLLSRATTRHREMAIRAAVGAGPSRVIRQCLAESLLLAFMGGAAGLVVARYAVTAVPRLWPEAVPRLAEISIDGPVLAFTLGITLLAGFLFGLVPALTTCMPEVAEVLKRETGTSSAAAGRVRLRGFLAASELALAIILLAGAGLLLKSFWRMHAKPAGFHPENILVMRVTLAGPRYSTWPSKQAYTEQLLQSLQSMRGVEAAGVDAGSMNTTVGIDAASNKPLAPGEGVAASVRGVSPGYLRAMGVPLIRGGWPPAGSLFGAMVNQTALRHLGSESVGRRIGGFILNDTITGVVADFKVQQLDVDPLPEIYIPYERLPLSRSMRFVVRTTGNPGALAPAVRRLVTSLDRTQALFEFQTLEEALAASVLPRRFTLFLLGMFAATALLLAVIGTYGVISYSVSMRAREFGIRLALGARPREILSQVLRQGAVVSLVGIVTGVAAGLSLASMMKPLLYDVSPRDPWIFSFAAAVLAVTGVIAAFGPALKAAHVDPLKALRYE